MAKKDSEVKLLLDIDKVLSSEEMQALSQAKVPEQIGL